ncbi:hypothetical protein D9757_004567 [Collybiopsis confluens]|uniref:DNA 3'-5' helicase n=1 Tax=Collybiopsis confluens TaxID=2823264 RepID=A0A8H5HWA9_9AGAR|nr:hypothetical protein D9757_004567 [Collybiopsis confluens]
MSELEPMTSLLFDGKATMSWVSNLIFVTYDGPNSDVHANNYHSIENQITFKGNKITLIRRPDGKVPLYNNCRRTNHPDSDDLGSTDIDAQVVVPPRPPQSPINPNNNVERDGDEAIETGQAESFEMEGVENKTEKGKSMEIDLVDLGAHNNNQISQNKHTNDCKFAQNEATAEKLIRRIVYESESDEGEEESNLDIDIPPQNTTSKLFQGEAVQFLLQYGIKVDSTYKVVICLECQEILHFKNIYGHKVTKHYRNTQNLPSETCLPPNETLLAAISKLGGSDPVLLQPLDGPIERIPGVKVISGKKCSVGNCTGHVYASQRPLLYHQATHPDVNIVGRSTQTVPCQPLNLIKQYRQYIEVFPTDEVQGAQAIDLVLAAANSCGLLEFDSTFTLASTEREKSAVFAQTRWDELIVGVDVDSLIATASPKLLFGQLRFSLLRNGPIKAQPFRRPQEFGKTVTRDADNVTLFICFLIVHQESPITNFPVILHDECQSQLNCLNSELDKNTLSESDFGHLIHRTMWLLLSKQSNQFLENDEFCPYTRFLLASHLKQHGQICRAHAITPAISRIQWCLRATTAEELLDMVQRGFSNYDEALALVRKYISEGHQVLFNSLRQNMRLLSALAYRQQGMARFIWSTDRHTLSIDGFPIHIPSFIQNLHRTVADVTVHIKQLFRGYNMTTVLDQIDQSMIPDEGGQKRWFKDHIGNDEDRYSFINDELNDLNSGRLVLLQHLLESSNLFHWVDNSLVANRSKINQWFAELETVVHGLYYLVVTTWGGGARGTETEKLLYANHPRNTRNVFFINGFLTIITEYSKTQSIKGAGNLLARIPAFQVSRLLILVLSLVYPAAGYINCYLGADKLSCSPYFYEMFVLRGKSMTSDNFSKVLGEYNKINAGVELKLADFRQFMACVLISSTHSNFTELKDEDDNVQAAHQSFNHSVETGRKHYGLDDVGQGTRIAPDAIAHMQQVSLRWHAFMGMLHPILLKKIDPIPSGSTDGFNSAAVTETIKMQFRSLEDCMQVQFEGFEVRTHRFMVRMFESLSTQILDRLQPDSQVPSYQNPRRLPVPPHLRSALEIGLGRMFTGFKSPEQAELINSSRSNMHVIGILPTGGGKSLAFFGAAKIYPSSLFLVISPLIALTHDHEAHRVNLSIKGGIWGDPTINPHNAQVVFVSAHLAITEDFINWTMSLPIQKRLRRVFIDEAHQILTGKDYRVCFRIIKRLIMLRVPITCLTATILLRSIPSLLADLEIRDTSLVDEIRCYTGRKNLQYHIEQIHDSEEIFGRMELLVAEYSPRFDNKDRGIIYCRQILDVHEVGKRLGCPVYTGRMDDHERKSAAQRWREGKTTADCWIVCTEAFGQGVDYPHVRVTLHKDPWELINWVQETGRLGRDGQVGVSFTFWSQLPPLLHSYQVDDKGRHEMRLLLPSEECVRLSFAPLDRITHSCTALGGELCSRCIKSMLVPLALDVTDFPQTNKRLTHSIPNDTSSELIPISVQTNSDQLSAEHSAGEKDLSILKAIIEEVVSLTCPDCWINGQEHDPTESHIRGYTFDMQQNALRISWKSNENWPFCWICWVPFRRPCNHPPSTPGQPSKIEDCPYQITDSATGKKVPILPHLILLIFEHSVARVDAKEFNHLMAKDLGVHYYQLTQFDRLVQWIKEPISTEHPVHHHIRYMLACCSCPEIFDTLSDLQKHDNDIHGHQEESGLKRKRIPDFSTLSTLSSRVSTSPPLPPTPASSSFSSESCGSDPRPSKKPRVDPEVKPATTPFIPPMTLSTSSPPFILYDLDDALTGHADISALFDFIAAEFSKVLNNCAFHTVMTRSTTLHNKVYACSERAVSSPTGEYKKIFTKVLRVDKTIVGTVCCRCWCPQHAAFGDHPERKVCPKDGHRASWEDHWRMLGYLIFRVTALRDPIFSAVGIPLDSFSTIAEYASWLTQPAPSAPENMVTNFVVVAYTYFRLVTAKKIAMPKKGLTLDVFPLQIFIMGTVNVRYTFRYAFVEQLPHTQ